MLNTCFVLFLRVGWDEWRWILSFLSFVYFKDFLKIVQFEVCKMIGLYIHVHGNDQGTIKVSVAKQLQEMSIRIPRKFISFAFKEQDMET